MTQVEIYVHSISGTKQLEAKISKAFCRSIRIFNESDRHLSNGDFKSKLALKHSKTGAASTYFK